MTTLREAAQQALEALQRIYIAPEHDEYIRVWWPACEDAIAALKAALAEPVQEPPRAYYTIDEINAKFDPPKRKPLTNEEIREMFFAELRALPPYPSAIEELPERFARAIERAHGIGERDGIA